MDRHRGAHILADNTHIRGQAAGGDFPPGQDFDQLFLATGRVFGGEGHDLDVGIAGGFLQGGDGFGFIVLDTQQSFAGGGDQVLQHLSAGDDFVGALAHEDVVGGDIGLAFGAVDNQGIDGFVTLGVEFHRRGKTRTAHTGDTGFANALQQLGFVHGAVVGHRVQVGPLVPAIRAQHNTGGTHAGGVGDHPVFDSDDLTGRGGVYRGADVAAGFRQLLTF